MIARFLIQLPFDLLISEDQNWPIVEMTTDEYRIKVSVPGLYAERVQPTDSILGQMHAMLNAPSFSENLLVNGKKVATVNVLTVDFSKEEFNRSREPGTPPDPKPELAFQIANEFLTRVRVYSRAHQIKPVVSERDPWRLKYLTDDAQELEIDPERVRMRGSFFETIGLVVVTPEIVQLVGDRLQTAEPYTWDLLLLDARALLPDVGSSIVIAAAALETFIAWALNILHEKQPLPGSLWKWINKRDHWTKEPSVSEEFDALLRTFTGHSLKDDEPGLWQSHSELRQARNALAHEGVAKIGGKLVEPARAKLLIDAAENIIKWVEGFVPEAYRRARPIAVVQSSRRIATPQESESLGLARIAAGQLGPLPSDVSLTFAFERKPDSEHEAADKQTREGVSGATQETDKGTGT